MQNNKHTLTLFEACEILNRSKKTLSRYVRQGRLHPIQVKSQQVRSKAVHLSLYKALRSKRAGQRRSAANRHPSAFRTPESDDY